MHNNMNYRMPQNPQRLIRPTLNRPRNNEPSAYGYAMPYPSSVGFRQRAPMFPSVYQHHVEDYQPYCYQPNYMDIATYSSQPNQLWPEQDYYQEADDQYSEMNLQSNHQQYVSQQVVKQQPARFSQKVAASAMNVHHSTAAVQKRNISATCPTSGNTNKARRMNPPMPFLPKPDSNTKRSVQQKSQTKNANPKSQQKPNVELNKKTQNNKASQVNKKEVPPQSQLSGVRFLVGSVPQLHKWNSVRHRYPPLYETVGTLMDRMELIKNHGHQMENHFRLRNLTELRRNNSSSMNELLECVIYSDTDYSNTFPVGISIRVVGRFQSCGLFQSLTVRRAVESDIIYLTSKVKGQTVNSGQSALSYSLLEQEELQQEPDIKEIENSFVEDSIFSHF